MEKIRLILLLFLVGNSVFSFSQVGIGTISPNPSSMLDVTSSTKGFLPPRMTYAQISSIASPAAGLTVYCTDCNNGSGCLVTYQNTKWECSGGSGALLPAPIAEAATLISCSGFTANWSAVTGATGYYFDVSITSDFSSYVTGYSNLNVGNAISLTVAGLTSLSTYYYRVRAYDAFATSPNSNTITAVTTSQPLTPVANTVTSLGCTGFTATWSAVNEATGYVLDVSTVSTFTSFVDGYNNRSIGNVTNYNVTWLESGTTYYWRVTATGNCGTSTASNTITTTTLTSPVAPTASAASNIGCAGFTANWSAVPGADSYRLDVSTATSFPSYLPGYQDLNAGNALSYTIYGLSNGVTCYYRVRAVNACSTSSNSGTITVTTSGATSSPIATAASNITNTSFTANWNAAPGATGYLFDLSTDNSFSTFVNGLNGFATGNATSFNVGGLSSLTTYYYRLKATSSCGNSTSYSNIMSTSTIRMMYLCGDTISYSSVTAAGYTWLDRNLGASRVAQSMNDYQAYGMHYQWGRQSDGHQCVTWTGTNTGTSQNGTTTTLCSNGTCSNSLFVVSNDDWNSPSSYTLWNGTTKGINDPCPTGYRVPSEAELEALANSFNPQNASGAFASSVKMPVSGYRNRSTGQQVNMGSWGDYWSSTAHNSAYSTGLGFGSSIIISWWPRAEGLSVRCIQQ